MTDKSDFTPEINMEKIKRYASQGKRFDGRGLTDYRDVSVELGVSKKAEGSVRVKIGKTEILAGVKMDVGVPYPDSQDKGNMIVSAELLPLSSPRIENGRPGFEAIELGRLVDRGLRESGFIDFEKLCIVKGEKVWNLFVDVYSINDDGNLLDACVLGAIIALKTAKMPKYDEKNEKVLFGEWSENKIPLTEAVPITICVYKIGKSLIVDPTREEEDCAEARISIGRTDETISSIQKSGPQEISSEEFKNILEISKDVRGKIFKNIEKHLK